VVGSSIDYAPFEFYQAGQITGFDVELAHQIAQKLGRSVKFVDLSFDNLVGALQTNRIDMAIAVLTPTPERQQAVDFTSVYYESQAYLLVLKDSPYKTLEDLKGKKVGAQLGSIFEIFLKKEAAAALSLELRLLNKVPDLLQSLKAKQLEGMVVGKPIAEALVKKNPEVILFPIHAEGATEQGAIALPKGSSLVQPLNAILKTMEEDGSLQKLKEKWKL
jgi:ABC-type amino acid transport substrate-binding protein